MGNYLFLHALGVGNRTSIEEKIANPGGGGKVTARIEPCIIITTDQVTVVMINGCCWWVGGGGGRRDRGRG